MSVCTLFHVVTQFGFEATEGELESSEPTDFSKAVDHALSLGVVKDRQLKNML